MKLGFTGTQVGMTDRQKRKFGEMVVSLGVTEFHHGDCIGADADAHKIVKALGIRVVLHPPTDERKRAFCEAEESRAPLPYLERNHAIVDESERMVATPKTTTEELRSGTWATVRYAKKTGKPGVILSP